MSQYVQLVAGASLTAAKILSLRNINVSLCWDGGRSVFRMLCDLNLKIFLDTMLSEDVLQGFVM
jgi:hypothetical protein